MINQRFLFFLILFGFSSFFTVLFAQETLLKARYVSIPYSLIDDDQISLTPSDFALWKSEIGELKQVYFISYDINFSSTDSLETYKTLQKNSQNFANNFQDTTLLFQNGGQRITLNPQMGSQCFSKPIGSTITFINDDELYVSMIIGKKQIADSVHARHILFQDATGDKVDRILNDLKNNKISWETANKTYNTDYATAQSGGDLGYFTQGAMIESFDKLCFDIANVGEYYRVETQFGEHIVQVIDKKFSGNSYSIQTLSYKSPVKLSKKTLKTIETKAQKQIGKSKNIDELESKLLKEGLELGILPPLPYPSGEMAKWINTAKNGEITLKPIKMHDNFTKKDKMIILGIRVKQGSAISDEDILMQYGFPMKQKKKEDFLYQNLKEFKSIESIASKYDVEIKEINLPNSEKKTSSDELVSDVSLQNKLFNYKVSKLTDPIIGFNGIYVAYIYWRK